MSLCGLLEWLHASFPQLVEDVEKDSIPSLSVDRLFVDMSDVIANSCRASSGKESDSLFLSYADVIDYSLHYLETIFCLIRPSKLLFISVPGVQPRCSATLTRRNAYLKSQKCAQLKSQIASLGLLNKLPISTPAIGGTGTPNLEPFDVNAVNPGTQLMCDLQKHLEYWVAEKITNDSDWQDLDVIISGQGVPGESKHKICNFLRVDKSKNTKNASVPSTGIFSNDPEMVLLASCLALNNVCTYHTEENSSSEVHPEKKNYKKICMQKFQNCLTSLFKPLFDDPKCHAKFYIHRLCADFALLCNLSGSSYFPPIPFLCSANSLEQILTTYKSFISYMKDYLISADLKINFTELCEFFDKIAYLEGRLFEQKVVPEMLKVRNDLVKVKGYSLEDAQLKARKEVYGFVYDQRPFPDDSNVATEFTHYRIGYYKYKLKFNEDNEVRRSGMGLLKTLCWVVDATLSYIPSWDWCYPFNYSPVLADIQGIADCNFQFAHDTPPTNLLHLLYVLPRGTSQSLLPLSLQQRDGVAAKNKVEVDKMHFAEAAKQIVVLPPHLDVPMADLKELFDSKRAQLTPLDLSRDQREMCKLMRSSESSQPPFYSHFNKNIFPDLNPCFTIIKELPLDECEPTKPKEVSKHGKVLTDTVAAAIGRQPVKEIPANPQLVPPPAAGLIIRSNTQSFGPRPNMGTPQIPSLRRNQGPYYQ